MQQLTAGYKISQTTLVFLISTGTSGGSMDDMHSNNMEVGKVGMLVPNVR